MEKVLVMKKKFCSPPNPRYRCLYADTRNSDTAPRCLNVRGTLPVDPVTGRERQEYCSLMRAPGAPCGPEGTLYEAAEPF